MGKTVAEKIFDSHVVDRPAEDVWVLRLDSVFCHEITTPTAILDLAARGKDRVFDPGKIKAVIDHVTPAKDSNTALQGKVLRDWARRHGITDFFDVGRNGVCHVLFPEKGYVRPGYAVVMGDSHTCTDGAFGAFTAGVGTTDLAVAILKGVCAFRTPRTMKVTLTGSLRPGVFAKDVILSVIGRIGMNGATNRVVEFDGPVVDADGHGSAHDALQHDGRGRRHLRHLPPRRGHRGLPLAVHPGRLPRPQGGGGRLPALVARPGRHLRGGRRPRRLRRSSP